MSKVRSSIVSSIFITIYFWLAPIYNQPFVSESVWIGMKLGLLLSLFLMTTVSVLRNGTMRLDAGDFVFFFSILITSFYLIKDMSIFFSVLVGYVFYLLGKNQHHLIDSARVLRNVIWSARISGLYVSFLLLSVLLGGRPDLITAGINPNGFALYVVTVSVVLFFSYGKDRKLIDALLLTIIGLVILYGGSRGGLLLFSCVFFVHVFMNWSRKSMYVVMLLFVMALFILLEPARLEDIRVYQQYISYTQGEQLDLSTGRVEGYKVGFSLLQDSMLTGTGDVNLHKYGLGYTKIHNFYLRMLVEGGVILFFTMILLLVSIWVGLRKADKTVKELSRSCSFLLFFPMLYEPSGLFGSFMIAGFLWYLIGCVSSYRIRSSELKGV